MADILSIGKTAQDAIDNFIDLWLTGLDVITGGNPNETTKAPMPFYCTGRGYWFTFNSNVSGVSGENNGWSYAAVDWSLYTANSDRDIQLSIDYAGIPNSSRDAAWNTATLNYWNKDNQRVRWEINEPYVINNQIDYFGYYFSSIPESTLVSGFRIVGDSLERYPQFIDSDWLKYDGSVLSSADSVRIQNIDFIPDYDSYTYSIGAGVTPISANVLTLPRTNDSYWVTIMPYATSNQNVVNNWYDTTENHNTNNQYLTENNVENYYNTYEVNLPDGLGFNIGVGGGGINITPIVPVGVAPIISPEIDFDDLIDILTPIVDDLNDNSGYDVDIQLHDFDYYLSRYMDYGDFYIKPLHQYDKLPHAQTFDGTVDLGDYPRVIGASVDTFLSFLPASLSMLFTAIFIIAIILDNLRGRR